MNLRESEQPKEIMMLQPGGEKQHSLCPTAIELHRTENMRHVIDRSDIVSYHFHQFRDKPIVHWYRLSWWSIYRTQLSQLSSYILAAYRARPFRAPSNVLDPSDSSKVISSGVKVQFSPVQHPFFPNPELDFWFGSDKSLNFELNLRFRSSSVRTQFEPFKIITKKFPLKKLFFYYIDYILTTYLHFRVWSFIESDLHYGIMTLMHVSEVLFHNQTLCNICW
jgi:hypothetical protein